jgi:hypothetical protein
MNDWMRQVLEAAAERRRAHDISGATKRVKRRQRLAALPFSEKLKILEKLRDRSLAIGVVREKTVKDYARTMKKLA